LLSWDYFSLVQYAESKPKWNLRTDINIPEYFYSLDNYSNMFEILVLEECISQILQIQKDIFEDQLTHGITTPSQKRIQGFMSVEFLFKSDVTYNYVDNDLVILSKDRIMNRESTDCITNLHVFGLITTKRSPKEFVIQFFFR
jgi:hypothetical protein